jgi:hypothetical protein
MFGHQLGGLPGEVAFVSGQGVRAFAEDVQRHHISGADSDLVEQ